MEEQGEEEVRAMSKEAEFERRLAAVEQAVAELQRRLADSHDPRAGLQKLIGSMTDVEGFDEVLRYGREFRHSDRPPDDDGAES
jgi:hypothetical protein